MIAQTKPVQREFDLELPVNRPLVPMGVAMVILNRGEDNVLNLIELGLLLWAFDIRTAKAKRREIRIYRQSLLDYVGHVLPQPGWRNLRAEPASRSEWSEVLKAILPGRDVRSFELAHWFTCDKSHISHLIRDGLLKVNRPAVGSRSAIISRSSAADFLKERRIA